MSQENVEIVCAAIDALNAGDWESVLSYAGANFEFDLTRAVGPQRGVYGFEQTPQVLSELREGFESLHTEPHEFIEVREHVVVPLTAHMVGRDGIEVQARTTWTWTFRDGAVERVCLYQERDEALKAAGLEE
jgi:ketosteroid isomerase-like protein